MLSPELESIKRRLLKLDTPAVSDTLDSLGQETALHGIASRVNGTKLAGPVFTVQYEPFDDKPRDFQNAGNYIDEVPSNHVILIDNSGSTECTNWGDILTRKALLQNIEGTIVNGSARDLSFIQKSGYPLFSRGIYMVSGKNRVRIKATNIPLKISGVTINPGDWAFADDNGALILPRPLIPTILERAEKVHQTELRIVEAIKNGESLQSARANLGYSNPWES